MADIILIVVIFALLRTNWILDDIRSDLRVIARRFDKSSK